MNVPTASTLPANLPRAEAEPGDLDARILRAEGRLLAREDRLHLGIHALGVRLRHSLQPRRLLLPAACAGAALVALFWLFRHRRHARVQGQQADAARPSRTPRTGGRWVPLAGLVWPMLPAHWRARVNPTVARLALGTGMPLLELLLARPESPPLETAGSIDRKGLLGLWYELGRLPAGGADAAAVSWRLTLREDGAVELRQQPENEDDNAPHKAAGACGVAVAMAGSGGARWRVSHWPALLRWLPMAWHQEAVLHLDAAATELLLGSPDREHLRLWARQPSLPRQRLDEMLALARERGFAVDRMQFAENIVSAPAQ
jgi:apolipoprotein D and lipocalin family protein